MRFIVDVYRYLILAFVGLMIAAAVYGMLKLLNAGASIESGMGIYIAAVAAVFGMVVLGLGVTATMISIHDRHAEIADELRLIREHLTGEAYADE